jgi:hypothetical protein
MMTIKVECDCGQRYAFEVEPINKRMPAPVACPACGADGTAAANAMIAGALALEPAPAPAPAPRISAAPPVGVPVNSPDVPPGTVRLDAPGGPTPSPAHLRFSSPAAPPASPATPPPIPKALPSPTTARPVARPPAPAKSTRGRDGWAKPETGTNKLGGYIVVGPGVLASLISAGFLGLQIPTPVLCAVVAVAGVVGGILNIAGRGPVAAGAFVGLITALGGYATAYWWIKGRVSVYTIEATIAFIIGCVPGFLLQMVLQKILLKPAGGGKR